MVQIGDKIKVKITSIKHYGFFFINENEIKGLVHISEISDKYVYDINDYFSVGDNIDIIVINYVKTKKQIQGSYKKANTLVIKEKEFHSKKEFQSLKEKLPHLIAKKMKEINEND